MIKGPTLQVTAQAEGSTVPTRDVSAHVEATAADALSGAEDVRANETES
jgi:hypothetical protein